MVFLPIGVVVSAKVARDRHFVAHQAGDVSTLKVVLQIPEGDFARQRNPHRLGVRDALVGFPLRSKM